MLTAFAAAHEYEQPLTELPPIMLNALREVRKSHVQAQLACADRARVYTCAPHQQSERLMECLDFFLQSLQLRAAATASGLEPQFHAGVAALVQLQHASALTVLDVSYVRALLGDAARVFERQVGPDHESTRALVLLAAEFGNDVVPADVPADRELSQA